MKIAITGKGGVGKTTITAIIAQTFADKERNVLAIDADPSPCLSGALGFPSELREKLIPIVEMDDLIYERTGAKKGTSGGFFTINPQVDDIPERFSVSHRGVRLLEMGAIKNGGAGCICPESALLKTLFTHLMFRKEDILLFDMYAGVEHLGRATVDFVDALLIIIEPTKRSVETAKQINMLANDLGLFRQWVIGNKIYNQSDIDFIENEVKDLPLLGYFNLEHDFSEADRLGIPVYDFIPGIQAQGEIIAQKLISLTETIKP